MGVQATGSVPSGLPARFLIGLNEGKGGSWMSSSGVPWDMRYQYLSKDWVTNWGHGDHDGKYALDFFYDTYERNMLPAVQFYQIVEEEPAGENNMLTKLGNPETMKSYFGDFKILLERAKDYGGPVVIMVEADGYGFAQIQSNEDPNHYAAVADTGLPELAGLPNTVAGWGLAYLALKKAVGADNALLGIHVSAWATNFDVMQNNDTTDLSTEVDVAYLFLSQLGLAENQTGLTYDFLVGDPSDRDAGYYEKVVGKQKWWDASDSASIESRSFNRFAEWLRLWNVKSGKRWMMWQVPVGNSNHLDVDNAGGPRQGYRDNRPEYFLGAGPAHIQKFADAGVIALLFGPGMNGMSTFDNDVYTDGQLFIKSRGQAIFDSGGLDIATGQAWTPSETLPRPRPVEVSPDADIVEDVPSRFEWDNADSLATDGWSFNGPMVRALEVSSEQAFHGQTSLAVRLTAEGGKTRILLKNPEIFTGTPYVIFHIYVPAGHGLTEILPYVIQNQSAQYGWLSTWHDGTALKPDAWNTVFVRIPAEATAPYPELGIELSGEPGAATTIYVDSVAWPDPGAVPAPGSGNAGSGATAGSGRASTPSNASCSVGAPASSSSLVGALALALLPLLRRRRAVA